MRWQPGFLAIVLLVAGCGGDPDPMVEAVTSVEEGKMPNLEGLDFDDLGGPDGLIFLMHDRLGVQSTQFVASGLPVGEIIRQEPEPGSQLDLTSGWTLVVSAGGPPTDFADLPQSVRTFAGILPGFDKDEPVLVVETAAGTAYKVDEWLFSDNCAAVEAAYRTLPDPRYNDACPSS